MTRMLDLVPRSRGWLPGREFFNHFFEDATLPDLFDQKAWIPAFDISEKDDAYVVHAELPGIDAKDLDVTLSDGVLTVKGEKRQESEDKDEHYRRVERRYGTFYRSFRIPEEIDRDAVDAQYTDGVLKLTLPKAKPGESKTKKIKVK